MKRWPSYPNPQPLFYRLYYNEQGIPLFYSMEDLPGTYIEIDRETFARSPSNVRVVKGRLVEKQWHAAPKLQPSDRGTACHPWDVAVIVNDKPCTKWSFPSNETD